MSAAEVRASARPLRTPEDLDPLLDRVGDARWVCIGEASHGTAEYYAWRAALTRRLVEEKGFDVIGVEGDWPDCWAVHRSVTGAPGAPEDPRDALDAFERWPTWMWANEEVVAFTRWLRAYNARSGRRPVGFYGLDVYSLWDSLHAVLGYLQEHEPEHVEAARRAARCLEPFREDPQSYASAQRFGPTSCESHLVALLHDLCAQRGTGPADDPDARFAAEMNAAAAAGAEHYYRAMVRGDESWNVRDRHMTDTLDRLVAHVGPGARVVVWEHNTHVGDARATDMARAGLVNVGQLVRERHGAEGVVLVGLGGHRGSVVAARAWGAPLERMPVPPARAGSLEDHLHAALGEDALLVWDDPPAWTQRWSDHRAIGVVYAPERERWGNYVPTLLGARYDAFLWLEETSALHPLHREAPASGELAGYPSGT